MPRIYTGANDPLDFCGNCFADMDEELALILYSKGEGPDGRGNCFSYDAAHPDYGGCEYFCYDCGQELDDGDN